MVMSLFIKQKQKMGSNTLKASIIYLAPGVMKNAETENGVRQSQSVDYLFSTGIEGECKNTPA
jgi:hypothetical protein